MSVIKNPNQGLVVTPRLVTLSPYEMYLEQLKGISQAIRVNSRGLSYIPSQFGGLKGQLTAINDQPVVRLVDFENPN